MAITILRETEPARLFCLYRGQQSTQGTYVELNCRDGLLRADYNPVIGSGGPRAGWHGHDRRYSIPLLQMDTVNVLMEEILPLAQRVVDGYEAVWDGHNYIAQLSEDTMDAEDEIERVISYYEADLHWGDASDWLYDIRSEIIERLRSGAATIDQLIDEYQGIGFEDDPILTGLRPHIEYLAGKAREEETCQ